MPEPTTAPAPAATPAAPEAPTSQPAAAGSAPAGTTPAPTGTPATPPGPASAPVSPTTASEARESLFRRSGRLPATAAEAKAAAAEHHSQRQPRTPAGEFAGPPAPADAQTTPAATAPGAEPQAPTTPPADTPAAAAAAPAPAAEQAAPVPDGFVRIDIPEGHYLRHRGDHYLVPKGHEDFHRWAVNNAIRRNQVEESATIARQWQEHAVQLEAELRATREFAESLFASPEVIRQAEEIGQAYGEDAKKHYLTGLWDQQKGKVAEHVDQAREQALVSERQAVADRFIDQAVAYARQHYPEWTDREIGTAVAAYGALVDAEGRTEVSLEEFVRDVANVHYARHPEVRKRIASRFKGWSEQQIEAARKAEADRLAAKEKEQLAAAAQARSEYPFLRVPAGSAAAREAPIGSEGPRTATEARRALFSRRRA